MRPSLFLRILSIESRRQMSYRADFWINAVLGFAAELTIAYCLWAAIFRASGSATLGGFTFDGMLLYYVAAILIGKLVRGQERELSVARDIYEGSLNRYLIYPTVYGVFKYAEHLGSLLPAVLQAVLFGLVASWALPLSASSGIDAVSVAGAVVLVALANLLAFMMRFPLQAVAFWADNVWSLNVMLRLATEFLGGLLLPLSLFPDEVAAALHWSPFPYLFYVPVQTLLGRVDLDQWLRSIAVMSFWCLAIGALSLWVWRRGERTYSGVGI